MKSMKKLIPAIAMLLVSAVLLGTSTFAWFSMNNKVTVTGMSVNTKVSENLLIADDTLTSTAKKDDSLFATSLIQNGGGILEPVSTVNGTSFFYAPNSNVAASGDAISDSYIAYNPADTSAFETNYVAGAKGYYDYVFQLKAINAGSASQIRLTNLKLTYGGTADTGKAYRVAMFVEDITSAAPAGTVGVLTTIFTPESAANFTSGEAVTSTTALASVTYCPNTTTAKIDVAASSTKYYKVVLRLWLEGEDNTCKNSTYMTLNDKWNLDVEFQLVASGEASPACVRYITMATTAAKIDLSAGPSSAAAAAYTINGVSYYKIGDTDCYLTAASTAVAQNTAHIYKIVDNRPVDVTNQCTLPAAP